MLEFFLFLNSISFILFYSFIYLFIYSSILKKRICHRIKKEVLIRIKNFKKFSKITIVCVVEKIYNFKNYHLNLTIRTNEQMVFAQPRISPGEWDAQTHYYYYFTPWEFFPSVIADCFPLEFEWQQISSSLQDSSQYSGWSQ